VLVVRWYLGYGLSYRDVEGCWLSVVSRSITSRFTAGCNGLRPCSLTQPGRADMPLVIAGSWMKPLSRSLDGASTRALQHGTHLPEVTTGRRRLTHESCCPPLALSCRSTRIIWSKPITADESPGYRRCAASQVCPQRGSSASDMRSSRTSAAATTNSESTNPPCCGWRRSSTNWPWQSDQPGSTILPVPASHNATARPKSNPPTILVPRSRS
jgi:hypothetical protein